MWNLGNVYICLSLKGTSCLKLKLVYVWWAVFYVDLGFWSKCSCLSLKWNGHYVFKLIYLFIFGVGGELNNYFRSI